MKFFIRYMLLFLIVGKMFSQRNTSYLTYKNKKTSFLAAGFMSGKVNNIYAPGLYLDIIPLCFNKFAIGFSCGGVARKTSNTFGTVNKKPLLDLGFYALKCHYIFNVNKRFLICPDITTGFEGLDLEDRSVKTYSSSYYRYYATIACEDFFTLIPALSFKYLCNTTTKTAIVFSLKYQVFPFVGKQYFSTPQSNEGFLFCLGWEGL